MERLVDFTIKTCDCFEWQDNDAPCRHAIAAAPMMYGREMTINPEKWFKHGWSPIYLTEEYIKAVEGIDVIPPRMDDLRPDGITLHRATNIIHQVYWPPCSQAYHVGC